ncbi:MAG: hypothetical protein J6T10_08200 [Methanobrevibacter sp.]|nr:hypothetical protein [Methanobrevibacter sp.]
MEIQTENTKRICKYGLQIESCRQCLFEALCNLEEQNARIRKECSHSGAK